MNDVKPPIRAVFLDIGDTIMRPDPSWEAIYAIAFAEFGVEVDLDALHNSLRRAYHHGGWGMEGGFDPSDETSYQRTVTIDSAAVAELGVGPMPDAFYRRLADLFMAAEHWHVFPEAHPTLAALHERDLVVGAVSNWVWSLPELLGSLDLAEGFNFVAASARIGFEKPHPRIFEWALEHAGVPPASVLHVGDHVDADVAGAAGVGIGGVLIDRAGRYAPDEIPSGTPVIRTLDELLPIIDARNGSR
ncbi:MAG: HAD-IA family hydrolase [Chloroflexi bacterium]|nr:HAD-IA family hydrolase [Chloroflexota bacterium]